jgi:hypothetical protein
MTAMGTLTMALLVVAGGSSAADAAPSEGAAEMVPELHPSAELELDFASSFLWHAIPLSSGPVMQPYAKGSLDHFTLAAFGSLTLAADPNAGHFTFAEADFGYERVFAGLHVEGGLEALWLLSQNLPGTAELHADLGYEVGSRVSVVTRQYVDVVNNPGAYFGDLGLRWEPELNSSISLELSSFLGLASAGFNAAYFGVAKGTWNDIDLEASLFVRWSLLYVRPHLEFGKIMDADLQRAIGQGAMVASGFAIGLEL